MPGPGVDEITLKWQLPASDGGFAVSSFRVYRGDESDGPYDLVADVPAGNLTYTDTKRSLGVYHYVVSAVNLRGEGPISNEATAFAFGPRVKTQSNPDGSLTVYDDRNGNGQADEGEEIAHVERPGPANVTIPGQQADESIPEQSTPAVPPQSVTTPGVTAPPTCSVQACDEPTTVSDEQTITSPEVPPQTITTPSVLIPQVCTPLGLVCVGPFTIPEQTVGPTPGLPSQNATVPAIVLPAVCSMAPNACLPATEVLPPQTIDVPGNDPMPLTPAVRVGVATDDFVLEVDPHLGETSAVGPVTVEIPTPFGPFPVTVCASTCPAPVPPSASAQGSVTVLVAVGDEEKSVTVGVDEAV
ncbi:MAG TPA: hypothetical protein VM681_08960 [Candidatus Thermoplasmatota archaeon]|nr:hypothetical protein [Candidatus Thermoplasmatota archaeon]